MKSVNHRYPVSRWRLRQSVRPKRGTASDTVFFGGVLLFTVLLLFALFGRAADPAAPPQKEVSGSAAGQAEADTNRLSVAAFRVTARPALPSASKEPRPGKGGGDGGMAAEGAPAREFRMMFDLAARAKAAKAKKAEVRK